MSISSFKLFASGSRCVLVLSSKERGSAVTSAWWQPECTTVVLVLCIMNKCWQCILVHCRDSEFKTIITSSEFRILFELTPSPFKLLVSASSHVQVTGDALPVTDRRGGLIRCRCAQVKSSLGCR
jgi:hypothetical protein